MAQAFLPKIQNLKKKMEEEEVYKAQRAQILKKNDSSSLSKCDHGEQLEKSQIVNLLEYAEKKSDIEFLRVLVNVSTLSNTYTHTHTYIYEIVTTSGDGSVTYIPSTSSSCQRQRCVERGKGTSRVVVVSKRSVCG